MNSIWGRSMVLLTAREKELAKALLQVSNKKINQVGLIAQVVRTNGASLRAKMQTTTLLEAAHRANLMGLLE